MWREMSLRFWTIRCCAPEFIIWFYVIRDCSTGRGRAGLGRAAQSPVPWDTYEDALFDGLGEVSRLRADERLYGDHDAETSTVHYVDRLLHGRKTLLVQWEIAHFRLPKLVEQHVTYAAAKGLEERERGRR